MALHVSFIRIIGISESLVIKAERAGDVCEACSKIINNNYTESGSVTTVAEADSVGESTVGRNDCLLDAVNCFEGREVCTIR